MASSSWDDPASWHLGGQAYCCPQDERVWVPKTSAHSVHSRWLRFTGSRRQRVRGCVGHPLRDDPAGVGKNNAELRAQRGLGFYGRHGRARGVGIHRQRSRSTLMPLPSPLIYDTVWPQTLSAINKKSASKFKPAS